MIFPSIYSNFILHISNELKIRKGRRGKKSSFTFINSPLKFFSPLDLIIWADSDTTSTDTLSTLDGRRTWHELEKIYPPSGHPPPRTTFLERRSIRYKVTLYEPIPLSIRRILQGKGTIESCWDPRNTHHLAAPNKPSGQSSFHFVATLLILISSIDPVDSFLLLEFIVPLFSRDNDSKKWQRMSFVRWKMVQVISLGLE